MSGQAVGLGKRGPQSTRKFASRLLGCSIHCADSRDVLGMISLASTPSPLPKQNPLCSRSRFFSGLAHEETGGDASGSSIVENLNPRFAAVPNGPLTPPASVAVQDFDAGRRDDVAGSGSVRCVCWHAKRTADPSLLSLASSPSLLSLLSILRCSRYDLRSRGLEAQVKYDNSEEGQGSRKLWGSKAQRESLESARVAARRARKTRDLSEQHALWESLNHGATFTVALYIESVGVIETALENMQAASLPWFRNRVFTFKIETCPEGISSLCGEVCAICLESMFGAGTSIAFGHVGANAENRCCHFFHSECLAQSLFKAALSRRGISCPSCRADFISTV